MSRQVYAVEVAKLRRLRVAPLMGVLVVGVAGLAVLQAVASPDFAESLSDPATDGWAMLLASFGFAAPLVSPLLLAVIAGRPVEIEHHSGGWLLAATCGLAPGRLCRVKLVTTGALVAVATLIQSGLVFGAGTLLGIAAPVPAGLWWSYTGCLLVVNLAVLATHLLLAARIENQLVGLGIGVLGIFAAVFAEALPAWAAHLIPWGYYTLFMPARYEGTDLVLQDLPYASAAGLLVVATVLFGYLTHLLDHREV